MQLKFGEAAQAVPAAEQRFSFGKNWVDFLSSLHESQIDSATRCLEEKVGNLTGQSFLDIGSGSGIHSLAASRLNAVRIHSFDYDADSIIATEHLRSRLAPGASWTVAQGSALDSTYLSTLGTFDVVYAWGVLHHTGDMWHALENAAGRVAPGGRLFTSIYNDQGRLSRRWKWVKRSYGNSGWLTRRLLEILVWCIVWGKCFAWDLVVLKPLRTFHLYRSYGRERGMSAWHDVVDWTGGYPFEVASPDTVFAFSRSLGFTLERLKTCGGGKGCNEFVFRKSPQP